MRQDVVRLTALALVAICVIAGPPAVPARAYQSDTELKAAFLYNFAKFTEWPGLQDSLPLTVCIAGDNKVADAFVDTVRGQKISGHAFDVERGLGSASWRACHVLYLSDAETRRSADALNGVKSFPVLTVSDSKGFAQSNGLIEFYLDGGRMRFAINVTAAEHSGLRLSARLLGLAKIVRDRHVP